MKKKRTKKTDRPDLAADGDITLFAEQGVNRTQALAWSLFLALLIGTTAFLANALQSAARTGDAKTNIWVLTRNLDYENAWLLGATLGLITLSASLFFKGELDKLGSTAPAAFNKMFNLVIVSVCLTLFFGHFGQIAGVGNEPSNHAMPIAADGSLTENHDPSSQQVEPVAPTSQMAANNHDPAATVHHQAIPMRTWPQRLKVLILLMHVPALVLFQFLFEAYMSHVMALSGDRFRQAANNHHLASRITLSLGCLGILLAFLACYVGIREGEINHQTLRLAFYTKVVLILLECVVICVFFMKDGKAH